MMIAAVEKQDIVVGRKKINKLAGHQRIKRLAGFGQLVRGRDFGKNEFGHAWISTQALAAAHDRVSAAIDVAPNKKRGGQGREVVLAGLAELDRMEAARRRPPVVGAFGLPDADADEDGKNG